MKHQNALRIGTILLILILVLLVWVMKPFSPAQDTPPEQDKPVIDPSLLTQAKSAESLDYLIYFEDQADLSKAYQLPWRERGWYVYDQLTAQAEESQREVRRFLEDQGVNYQSFWIQNVIAVEASNNQTLYGLLDFMEIDTVQPVPRIFLEEPAPTADQKNAEILGTTSNLDHIHANDAWSLGFAGEGMIVGSIDTGVRFTHEALTDQYRGNQGDGNVNNNFNWWDAVNGQSEPYDDQGHGTHTTGIMVGASSPGNEIGVAPDAEWIACKAISQAGVGYGWDFIKCGQFMLAPTDLNGQNNNPDLRPYVINNSWGGCGQTYSAWFESTIDAWLAAGIYPVFSNGNASNCGYSSPPGLGTVGNPARSYHVTAVGSTGTDNGQYANHSNWGPTDNEDTINPNGYPFIKPQVVAPGVSIRSAVSSSDSAYAAWSGTSMSAPHAAGLVALMWQAGGCLVGDYAVTETLLQESAVPIDYATGNGDEGPGNVPNYATGWGEIDALAAVETAREYCGGRYLTGHVYDAETQAPIQGAEVAAAASGDPSNDRSSITDEDGFYSLAVNSGETYAVTASAVGYLPITEADQVMPPQGGTLINEFYLEVNTSVVSLTGQVLDGSGHGYPLYARILVEGGNHHEVLFTDPIDGTFDILLYQNVEYSLSVSSMISGYDSLVDSSVIFTEPKATRDYELVVGEACDAPGYQPLEEPGPGSQPCSIILGGVVTGFVRDDNNGEAIDGAKLAGKKAVTESIGTPEDGQQPDGFYWLFQPISSNPELVTIDVSKGFYLNGAFEVTVFQDEITRLDPPLESITHSVWTYLGYLFDLVKEFLRTWFGEVSAKVF